MIGHSSGVLLALCVGVGVLHAQTMRSFSSARQVHGETQLTATVQLTAGSLRLAPGGASTLYHLEVIYDADRFKPNGRYDAVAGEVLLGFQSIGAGGLRVSKATQLGQAANVVFSPAIDLTLDARLEAVNAELELGGLRLVGFTVSNGGSKTVARFTTPNLVRCTTGAFRAGAAEFRVFGLGNSRCDIIRFEGGVGATVLDFSGAWRQDMTLEARVAAGGLTLRLPRGVGVRMTTDNFLALLDREGFVERDGAYYAGDYESGDRRLDISLKTSLGQVKVDWVDPAGDR